MKSVANSQHLKPLLVQRNIVVGIVYASWNEEIVQDLKQNCINQLHQEYGQICNISIVEISVPGSNELPIGCKKLLLSVCKLDKIDVIVTLGCLIQGETSHMSVIASSVSQQLQSLSIQETIPIIFGVLTCQTIQQAKERVNLGQTYADAALAMCTLVSQCDLQLKINKSLQVIKAAVEKFAVDTLEPSALALSFNGGKDCTVVLELLHMYFESIDKPMTISLLFFDQTPDEFTQIYDVLQEIADYYEVDITTVISKDRLMKDTFNEYIHNHPEIKAIFLGQRSSDKCSANCVSVTEVNMENKTETQTKNENKTETQTEDEAKIKTENKNETDEKNGWSPIELINPILEWTHAEVWSFLLSKRVPYCSLYNEGFTSLGKKSETVVNPFLPLGKPAWYLQDANLERAGRK